VAPTDGRRATRPAAWVLAVLVLASLLAGCLSDPSTSLRARRGDLAELELVVADGDRALLPATTTVEDLCGHPIGDLVAEGCPQARHPYALVNDPPAQLPDGFTDATGLPAGVVDEIEGLAEGETVLREDVQAWGPHDEELVNEHDRQESLPRVVDEPDAYGHDWNTTQREDGRYELQPTEDDEGAQLHVPRFCNERFCLFTSELVDWNRTHLVVEHGAEEGDQVRAGDLDTFLTVVQAGPETFTVDGNDPRAGGFYDVYVHVVDLRGPPEGDERAPSFELTSLEGERVALEDLLGQPVVIEFFATWCPSCAENADHLVQVHERFGDAVNIVSIGVDPWESPESLNSFVDEHGITWPVAVDESGDVSEAYGVGTLSTEVLVDPTGVIRLVETGVADHDRVASVLERLVGEDDEGELQR